MNDIDIYQNKEQALFLTGQAGKIEAILQGSEQPRIINQSLQIAIILHPHPLHEGTMHNKVVYTLARACKQMDIPVLRYNFRGVGQSEGSHDHGIGETTDLLHIMQQLEHTYPKITFWLAGFSFGSFVAYQAFIESNKNHGTNHKHHIRHLCLVGPPVERYAYPLISLPQDTGLALLQGSKDEIVNPETNYQWFAQLQKQQLEKKQLQLIKLDTGHFFHGKLIELKESYISLMQAGLNHNEQS